MFFQSPEHKDLLLNATTFPSDVNAALDIDSFPLTLDLGALSAATPFKPDLIKCTYWALKGMTISVIAFVFSSSSVDSVAHKIKDDTNLTDFQIDQVFHLE